jgi:hypothetical protein
MAYKLFGGEGGGGEEKVKVKKKEEEEKMMLMMMMMMMMMMIQLMQVIAKTSAVSHAVTAVSLGGWGLHTVFPTAC